ncbi:MAG: hypothetical protein L6R40_005997 [Gallowayella cf. fulva]|nr:MAG: hypothetical protein L6R40_005997 [Xanthomendoza cf. fulva]
MADPVSVFSIASGAAALAFGCGKTAKILYEIAQRFRDTQSLISSIAQELTTTQYAWDLIRQFLDDGTLNQDLLHRMNQSLDWGALTLQSLDDELSSCTRRLAISQENGLRYRTKVVWNEKSLMRHQNRIRGLTMSMSLLISVLKVSCVEQPSRLAHIKRPVTPGSHASLVSKVPSRASVNPTARSSLEIFDDMVYQQLSIDDDLFTSKVYK